MNDVVICLWGSFDRAAEGVAGAGRRLADETGADLQAVVIGDSNDLPAALTQIADRVIVAADPRLADYQAELYLDALAGICRGLAPRAVLLASDTYSQELVPRLAHRLGGSSMADGGALEVAQRTPGDTVLRVTRSAYGGRAVAIYELCRAPAVVWLRARSFAPAAAREGAPAAIVKPQLDVAPEPGVRIVERHVETQEGVPLEEASLIVSGGRGLGGPGPFADLDKLAAVMGAAVGASRVACDEGWVPPTRQIPC